MFSPGKDIPLAIIPLLLEEAPVHVPVLANIAIAKSVVGEVPDYHAFLDATQRDVQILKVGMLYSVHFHDRLKGSDGDVYSWIRY